MKEAIGAKWLRIQSSIFPLAADVQWSSLVLVGHVGKEIVPYSPNVRRSRTYSRLTRQCMLWTESKNRRLRCDWDSVEAEAMFALLGAAGGLASGLAMRWFSWAPRLYANLNVALRCPEVGALFNALNIRWDPWWSRSTVAGMIMMIHYSKLLNKIVQCNIVFFDIFLTFDTHTHARTHIIIYNIYIDR